MAYGPGSIGSPTIAAATAGRAFRFSNAIDVVLDGYPRDTSCATYRFEGRASSYAHESAVSNLVRSPFDKLRSRCEEPTVVSGAKL